MSKILLNFVSVINFCAMNILIAIGVVLGFLAYLFGFDDNWGE